MTADVTPAQEKNAEAVAPVAAETLAQDDNACVEAPTAEEALMMQKVDPRPVHPVCLFEGCGKPFGEFCTRKWAKETPCDYCDRLVEGLWLCNECSAMCCGSCAWKQSGNEQCWYDKG